MLEALQDALRVDESYMTVVAQLKQKEFLNIEIRARHFQMSVMGAVLRSFAVKGSRPKLSSIVRSTL
jgi:hypothetical protein